MNLRTRPTPAESRRRGFTLTEILVILGIIVLVLVLALPAFTAITGSRSVEASRNLVAASIVRARAEAIRRGQPCGVFFYVDPDTRRTGAAIVTLSSLTDPDPYDEYKSFHAGGAGGPTRDYQGGTFDPLHDESGEPYMSSDRVIVLAADGNPGTAADNPATTAVIENTYPPRYAAYNGRPLMLTMQRTQEPGTGTAGGSNPLMAPGDTTTVPNSKGAYVTSRDPDWALSGGGSINSDQWKVEGITGLELIDGIEPEMLPSGVGVQLILTNALDTDARVDGAVDNNTGTFIERYSRYGLILFDQQGRLLQSDYYINGGSRLGNVIGMPDVPLLRIPYAITGAPLTFPTSQLGLVLYETDAFENAASDGTALHWEGNFIASANSTAADRIIADFETSEADQMLPGLYFNDLTEQARPTIDNEYAEERWLDVNTIPLMVNRYSGTLVDAE